MLKIFLSTLLFFFFSGCFVPQSKYKAKIQEIDNLQGMLEKENERKRQEIDNNARLNVLNKELKESITKQMEELKRLAQIHQSEKSNLLQLLDSLEIHLTGKINQIHDLQGQKMSLEKEKILIEKKWLEQHELENQLRQEIAQGKIEVEKVRDGLKVKLIDKILFESGSAQIEKEGEQALKKIAEILKTSDKTVRVEGHTDNVPLKESAKKLYPTNWELSTARATAVLRFLETNGVLSKKLSIAGYSEFYPVASNETPAGRQSNRRIEIILLPGSN